MGQLFIGAQTVCRKVGEKVSYDSDMMLASCWAGVQDMLNIQPYHRAFFIGNDADVHYRTGETSEGFGEYLAGRYARADVAIAGKILLNNEETAGYEKSQRFRGIANSQDILVFLIDNGLRLQAFQHGVDLFIVNAGE